MVSVVVRCARAKWINDLVVPLPTFASNCVKISCDYEFIMRRHGAYERGQLIIRAPYPPLWMGEWEHRPQRQRENPAGEPVGWSLCSNYSCIEKAGGELASMNAVTLRGGHRETRPPPLCGSYPRNGVVSNPQLRQHHRQPYGTLLAQQFIYSVYSFL